MVSPSEIRRVRNIVLGMIVPAILVSFSSLSTAQTRQRGRSDHPATDLTAQASDPTAPLIQLLFTNFYAPVNFNGEGYANLFEAQPVVPVPQFSGFSIGPGDAAECAARDDAGVGSP